MMKRLLILLFSTLLMTGCFAPKSADLKLMSFNIRFDNPEDGENNWHFRKFAVAAMIDSLQPDIIGMQEVTGSQRQFLNDSIKGYAQYGLDRDSGLPDGDGESMSVLYRTDRFDVVDEGTIWLSETPDTVSKGWDAACIRTATWVQLKDKNFKGREIFFLNTHFDHKGNTARIEEGKMLMKWIDEKFATGATMVLTGDFNSTIEDEALVPLLEGMTYVRTSAKETDSTGTYQGFRDDFDISVGPIIDHIFVKGIEPLTYRVVTEDYGVPFISDHYPIIATADYIR